MVSNSLTLSEAFQSSTLQVTEVALTTFLQDVAANAPCVGIDLVQFCGADEVVMARADAYSLEDVVTHVLRNAARHRTAGSAITITLAASETAATITIHNRGAGIAPELIDKIFEYGVSGQHEAENSGNRGQGLFVAKTYMAKMGGTIAVSNLPDGVSFVLSLQRCDA